MTLDRSAPPKPRKGTAQLAARERSAARKAQERREMQKARVRDGGCRYPGCACRRHHLRVDVCHEEHRGMGGDKSVGSQRTRPDKLLSLCLTRHDEWDHGDLVITPTDRALGFNGGADFYKPVNGQLQFLGRTFPRVRVR